MKRKLQIAAVLLGLWPIIIVAAQGDGEVQLSGNGSSDNDFNTNNFGASTSVSYWCLYSPVGNKLLSHE